MNREQFKKLYERWNHKGSGHYENCWENHAACAIVHLLNLIEDNGLVGEGKEFYSAKTKESGEILVRFNIDTITAFIAKQDIQYQTPEHDQFMKELERSLHGE